MFDLILEKEREAISRKRCKRLEFLSQMQAKKKNCDHDSSRSDMGLSHVAIVSMNLAMVQSRDRLDTPIR
jgi:hypothetical protein